MKTETLYFILLSIIFVVYGAPRFSGDQLHHIDVSLDDIDGQIGCFGDFNNDRFTDIFIISSDLSMINVYLWDSKNFKFTRSTRANITITDSVISNIAATDFNHDGILDLLVQGTDKDGQNFLNIYFGDYQSFISMISLFPSDGPVSIFDYNLDLKPDLLGNFNHEGKLIRSVWLNNGDGKFFDVIPFSNDSTVGPIMNTHSTSLVDFDGDCLTDLMIPSTHENELTFEMWILNSTTGTFKPHSSIKGAKGQGQITFADFDGDGNMDILFPVCDPFPTCENENSIKIIFNQQKSVCGSLFQKECRSSSALCTSDPHFKFDPFNTSQSNENVVIINQTTFGEKVKFNAIQDIPLIVRSGDYNLDRFPDLLIPLKVDGVAKIQLWKNVPCTQKLCGSTKRRTFIHVDEGVEALSSINNTYTSTFFDIDEGGKNDILVLKYDKTQKKYQSTVLYNNFYNDAYFLKMLGLNGVCTMCLGKEKKPYSVNQHGTTFKYTFSDLGGTQTGAVVSQLPQSTHLSLHTPYTLSGLARPASYVDYIFMGVTVSNKNSHFQSWPGIIPNSQVVISPYPPENPDKWVIELYISPSSSTVWIVLAVCCWLVVIGAAILGLQFREKKQDEKEKKEKEHLFSFKAM